MNRKVKYIQYGCGRMGSMCMKYALSKGAEVIAAYDASPLLSGMDIQERMGTTEQTGIKIRDAKAFKAEITEMKPDIVVITTQSLLKDIYEALKTCAKAGVNAITTCEEAIYPWTSAVRLTKELDEISKANNCTLTGSGAQEMQWCSLISTLAGSLNKVTKIYGVTQNNVDDYGIAFANSFGVGMNAHTFEKELTAGYNLTDKEIDAQIEKGQFIPGFMWNSNAWLADKLGLTIKRQSQKLIPHLAEKDVPSITLDRVVGAGFVKGSSQVVTTETEEGITIESAVKAVIYGSEDLEYNDWILYGEEEELKVSLSQPPTREMTCAMIVNRIPDVINAPAGFVTTSKMPNCTYLAKPMNEYIK